MIGNDIVDLDLAKKKHRWQDQRFLQKIFSKKEQQLISEAADPFCCIWRLWSMKESAFKALKHTAPGILFSPVNYHCDLYSSTTGNVTFENHLYQMNSMVEQRFIYTFTATDPSANLINTQFKILTPDYHHQHSRTLERLTDEIAKIFVVNVQGLRIKKNELGAPEIYYQNRMLPLSVSISHHGHFCAYFVAIRPNSTSFNCLKF
jgi:phosphopantetheinyl transferase (holo-ACP synthase)